MGVDNSGYLVVGDEVKNIDFAKFPKYDEYDENEYEDIGNYYYCIMDDIIHTRLNWELTEPRGYERSEIFGFCLSSPSYGTAEFNYTNFVSDLNMITVAWRSWTGRLPKIFVMNVQD